MVPTEDTIEALLDYLVSPLLPLRESNDELPSDHQQKTIAKQLHATVILYNYYHRKQFPKLEFLGFESFCKICCIAKPGLLPYLRCMHKCEEDSENLNSQSSITEKMVMDACNICIGLDSGKDYPVVEGWPISKVAVFLVHPTKEKCVLQFCNITLGVWSLVEKDLELHSENGSLQTKSHQPDKVREQLAFAAVEQETGISRSELCILEHHLTYSLTRETTTTLLYIMKYGRTLSEEVMEVSIKEVITSLEGPIVKQDPTCEVTSVVEYYNILPYEKIISSWLSRDDTDHISLDIRRQQIVNEKKRSLAQNEVSLIKDPEVNTVSNELKVGIQSSKPSKSDTAETSRNDLSSMNGSSEPDSRVENTASSPRVEPDKFTIMNDQAPNDKSLQNGVDKKVLNSKKNKLKDAITYNRRAGGSCGASKILDSKHLTVPNRLPNLEDGAIIQKYGLNKQSLNVKSNLPVKTKSEIKKNINDHPSNNRTSCAISGFEDMEPDGTFIMNDEATNDISCQSGQTKDIVTSKTDGIKDAIVTGASCMNTLSTVNSCKSGTLPLNDHQKTSQSEDITGNDVISDAPMNKENRSIQNDLRISVIGFEEQAVPVDSVKCLIEDKTNGNGAYQEGSALGDQTLVPKQSSSSDHNTFYYVMASKKDDVLQASLRVLQKKRNELYQQKHFLENEIARCEMNIQSILQEGEENLALKVESIIEALDVYCSSQVQTSINPSSEDRSPSHAIKRRKLSEAVLTSRNSCQELDAICHWNSWLLPIYNVFPSLAESQITGMYKATVAVHGTDFECTSDGDCRSSPREARESAATKMLDKLRMWQARER